MYNIKTIRAELASYAKPERLHVLRNFFKTGKGQYAEGDVMIGVYVPDTKKVAAKFRDAGLDVVLELLRSTIHEERLLALMIMEHQFENAADEKTRTKIYKSYISNTKYVNNWDLVDSSAHYIAGPYLQDKDKAILYRFAKSKLLWERRIAMISTFHYIRQKQFGDALKIADILINDTHDLMHKAVGWMLREIGKLDLRTEEKFLNKHAATMPRTTLRYAIERFTPERKKHYMGLKDKTKTTQKKAKAQRKK